MRTKIIDLHTGERITLYMNEETGLWVSSIDEAQDAFHSEIMNGKDKVARTIRKYYSCCSIPHTRKKIRQMVNEGKTNLLFETIIGIRGY